MGRGAPPDRTLRDAHMTLPTDIDAKKEQAALWFRQLRDELCANFEAIEDEGGMHVDRPAGRFEIKPWARPEGGGGEIGLLHGRVFEKAGVHISIVHGRFSDEFARQMPHTEAGRRILERRRLGHRPPLEPERSRGAHEHAHDRHRRVVVRRRRRPDTGARSPAHADRSRQPGLPRRLQGRLRRPRLQLSTASRRGAMSISSSSTGTSRAASAASSSTISTPETGTPISPSPRTSAAPSSTSIPTLVRRNFDDALDRRRPQRTAHPPRPLCRVQPALRPRHHLRPQDRRQCRRHPELACPPRSAGRSNRSSDPRVSASEGQEDAMNAISNVSCPGASGTPRPTMKPKSCAAPAIICARYTARPSCGRK